MLSQDPRSSAIFSWPLSIWMGCQNVGAIIAASPASTKPRRTRFISWAKVVTSLPGTMAAKQKRSLRQYIAVKGQTLNFLEFEPFDVRCRVTRVNRPQSLTRWVSIVARPVLSLIERYICNRYGPMPLNDAPSAGESESGRGGCWDLDRFAEFSPLPFSFPRDVLRTP